MPRRGIPRKTSALGYIDVPKPVKATFNELIGWKLYQLSRASQKKAGGNQGVYDSCIINVNRTKVGAGKGSTLSAATSF